jgi:nucleoid-associated protein YgaU
VLAGPSVVSCFNGDENMGICLRGKMVDAGLIPSPATAQADPEVAAPPVAATGVSSDTAAEIAEPAEPLAAEPTVESVQAEAAPAVPDDLIAATFGLLRAEPDGSLVIAGSGRPGTEIEVFANDELLGRTMVEPTGDWVLVPETPLPPGGVEITLGEVGRPGRADQSFVVAIAEDRSSEPLVLASRPGEATEILQGIEDPVQIAAADPVESPQRPVAAPAEQGVTEVQPTAEPSGETAPAQEEPAVEPVAPIPAEDAPPADEVVPAPVEPAAEPEPQIAPASEPQIGGPALVDVVPPVTEQVPQEAILPELAPAQPDELSSDAPVTDDPVAANVPETATPADVPQIDEPRPADAPIAAAPAPADEPVAVKPEPADEPVAVVPEPVDDPVAVEEQPVDTPALEAAEPALPPAPAIELTPTPDAAVPLPEEPVAGPEPETAIAAVEPPVDEPQTVVLAAVPPTIDAIEIEGDRTFFAGGGPEGAIIRLYVDDAYVADAEVEDGRWLVEAGDVLDDPSQRVRIDMLQPGSSNVAARAEVDFVVELPQDPVQVAQADAVAAEEPDAPAEPTPVEAPQLEAGSPAPAVVAPNQPETTTPAPSDEPAAPAEPVTLPPSDEQTTPAAEDPVIEPSEEPLSPPAPVSQPEVPVISPAEPAPAGVPQETAPATVTPAAPLPEPAPEQPEPAQMPAPDEVVPEQPVAPEPRADVQPTAPPQEERLPPAPTSPAATTDPVEPPPVPVSEPELAVEPGAAPEVTPVTPVEPPVATAPQPDVVTDADIPTPATDPAPAAEPEGAVTSVEPEPADAPVAEPEVPVMVAVAVGSPDAQRFASGKAIIRRGDNLWTIARRVYGEGIKYTTIYQANDGQIRDPDRIYPGQVFELPTGTVN